MLSSDFLKLYSWNVNGFRSVLSKNFDEFLATHTPDILCLQEIKMSAPPGGDLTLPFAWQRFHSADKAGYSGTAILSRVAPLSVTTDFPGDHPREGRVISAEFARCHVVCAYVPNSQHELARLDYRLRWDADFRVHLARLSDKKPVFLCGDLNCAHNPIDLEHPSQNRRSAGFSDEERASFSALLAEGYADTFRETYPDQKRAYSWWSYRSQARANNVGWRIDYWLAAHALVGTWHTPKIHSDVPGSDHCPVSLCANKDLF